MEKYQKDWEAAAKYMREGYLAKINAQAKENLGLSKPTDKLAAKDMSSILKQQAARQR
ncbi:MAG: hypothetical protein IJ184_00175 [Alphaproteobacteria bacterium]|nr:hypothetical protein [Alphaproteobacteria bacterium]